jgi:phenylalanine-4-hydroxylase
LKGINLSIENMGPRELQAYNFYDGKPISFEFESGITVEGLNVTGMRNLSGKLMLIQFTDCAVTYKDEVLFSPEMGDFDMAVGKEIVSAFAGAADYRSYHVLSHKVSNTETVQPQHSEEEIELNKLYRTVREIREQAAVNDPSELKDLFNTLRKDFPSDWLLPLEICELVSSDDEDFSEEIKKYLNELKNNRTEVAHLIQNGLSLIN